MNKAIDHFSLYQVSVYVALLVLLQKNYAFESVVYEAEY